MTIFDVILMLIIAVEYPTFKKLKDQANFASAEIEAALVTTGFRIPEDYTDRTKKIRSKIEQEPKKLMVSAVSIGILALTCFGGMGMILWACSFSGFEDFNAWYAARRRGVWYDRDHSGSADDPVFEGLRCGEKAAAV